MQSGSLLPCRRPTAQGTGLLRWRTRCPRHTSHLQSHSHSESIYDINAYTITLINLDGMLQLFTSYLRRPAAPEDRSEYCMHQLRSFALTDSTDTFRHAARAYRNARDWAEEKRNAFIDAANVKVPDSGETDTSVGRGDGRRGRVWTKSTTTNNHRGTHCILSHLLHSCRFNEYRFLNSTVHRVVLPQDDGWEHGDRCLL